MVVAQFRKRAGTEPNTFFLEFRGAYVADQDDVNDTQIEWGAWTKIDLLSVPYAQPCDDGGETYSTPCEPSESVP